MEPIVAKRRISKRQIYSTPIPIIGIESALELASNNLDDLEIEANDKLSCIAVAAYYKAQARGYEPGHELQDWLDAEAEIMKKTRKGNIE